MQAHEEGIGEAECRREAEENQDENKDLLESERLETNENHLAMASCSTGRAMLSRDVAGKRGSV